MTGVTSFARSDLDDRVPTSEVVEGHDCPAFDETLIRSHFTMLHKLASGIDGELVLAVFGENTRDRRPIDSQVKRFVVGDVDGMVATAMAFENAPHANVYAPLHVVRQGLRDGQRGSAGDIVAVLGLVADMDGDTGRAGEMPVEASLVIETSPGNSQPIILFDRPLSLAEAKPLAESLRAATKSDSGTADVAHVWRVPGTNNWPNAKKLARGRSAAAAPVRIVKKWDGSVQTCEALANALRAWRPAPQVETVLERSCAEESAALPPKLFELIRDGAEVGERSQKFMHAVGWLKDLGCQPEAIEELFAANPTGIAEKYDAGGRLRSEIDRCYEKARSRSDDAFAKVLPVDKGPSQDSLLIWHGEEPPQPPCWLVRNILPETGVALLAGQYASGKTFVAVDLAASVLTGADFVGEVVSRRGGVLWLAAEGETEVEARLSAVTIKLREAVDEDVDLEHLAFARQRFDVPSLTKENARARLEQLAEEARDKMRARYGFPLALIVIDTLAAAAVFDDENSASETQKVMDVLRRLSRFTGALVVAIDHFGKTTETGIRGSSAKGAAADAILAILAEKGPNGCIKNRRLAVDKLRSGATGRLVPFELRPVPIAFGEGTTCVVDWRHESAAGDKTPKPAISAWRGRTIFLKRAMEAVMRDGHGQKMRPSGDAGVEVLAVERARARDEFYASIPIDRESGSDAKRKAFNRAIDNAIAGDLIWSREIDCCGWLWFTSGGVPDGQFGPDSRTARTAPKGALSCPSVDCQQDRPDK